MRVLRLKFVKTETKINARNTTDVRRRDDLDCDGLANLGAT